MDRQEKIELTVETALYFTLISFNILYKLRCIYVKYMHLKQESNIYVFYAQEKKSNNIFN